MSDTRSAWGQAEDERRESYRENQRLRKRIAELEDTLVDIYINVLGESEEKAKWLVKEQSE